MGINDELADAIIGRAVNLQRFSESVRLKILKLLEDLRDELTSKVSEAGLDPELRATVKYQRQEALLRQIKSTIDTAYGDMQGLSDGQLLEVSKLEADATVRMFNKVFEAKVTSTALTPAQLETLVGKTIIDGAPSKEWWSRQSATTRLNFAREVRLGVAAGETNDQLVRRIRGRATGRTVLLAKSDGAKVRTREFTGGVLQASTREATAMVRTSVQAVAQETRQAVYGENQDVLKGWAALVTLDSRTTLLCISRSGGAWDFEGKPLPQSAVKIPFPGRPPWHWNCRTQLVPVVKSLAEMAKLKNPPKLNAGTQASMDGHVPRDMTYEEWLKTKPESFQMDVLGPGRFKLWKENGLSLTQLVDPQGNELTLDELRKLV